MFPVGNVTTVLAIFAFYAGLVTLLGFVGGAFVASELPALEEPGLLTFLVQGVSLFVSGIFFSLSNIPLWVTTILFLPLGVALSYIGLSYLRGSS